MKENVNYVKITELTYDDTKMIQGLSILAMLILHLFDRLDYQELYLPILYLFDKPVVFYLAQVSDFCVMGFAFCSGYSLYKLYNYDEKYYIGRLKGILKLLIDYWIILIIFTLISILIGNKSQMPGTTLKFIENFTTINTSYNGSWWYLFIYIFLVLISPIIFKIYNKIPNKISIIISFLIYISAYYIRFYITNKGWLLNKYGLLGMTFFEFMVGVIIFKGNWIERVNKMKYSLTKNNRKILAIGILGVIFLGHTLIIPSLFIAPLNGIIIIIIFVIWNKRNWIKKIFLFLGEHSTNIWLTHMFFYLYIFKNLVFIGRYPAIILVFMLCITIVFSLGINYIKKYLPVKI